VQILRKNRHHRPAAVIAAVSLVAAACGARVAPYVASTVGAGTNTQQSQGSNSPFPGNTTASTVGGSSGSHSNSPTPAGGVSGSQGSTGGGTASASTVPGGGSNSSTGKAAGGVTVADLTPANFPFDPQQQAALCTGASGNSSSAPGVTPTSITLGNVSGLSGLIPSSFQPGYQAVTAAFNAVNRFGGICGRQLKLKTEDDQQNASNDQADVQDLIPNVLAFVGSLSDADNGGVSAMVAAGTPDMGPAINTNRSNSSVYWSATGGSVIVRNGRAFILNGWLNGLKANNDLPKSMAILSYSIAISANAGREFASAFQQEGVKICYSDYNIQAGAQATSIPSDVRQIQAAGCGGVYTTMDVVGNANMLDAMQNDNYSCKTHLCAVTYEGYTPDQISTAGQSAAQGLQVALNSVPLTDPNAGVQAYQQELAEYEPGQKASQFGLEAWADAEMFIYAVMKAGRNPTRASLTNALSQITNWSTDGAFGPYSPRDRTGPLCVSDVVVKGNAFVRDWPSQGLYCNGQLVDVGPAS
jgi:ABC-type branched-subunit amino acid transport system substrate-binding protein